MKNYAITAAAGRYVAGTNNTGAGTILPLSDAQAAHELRLGTIVFADPDDLAAAEKAAAKAAKAAQADAAKAAAEQDAKAAADAADAAKAAERRAAQDAAKNGRG